MKKPCITFLSILIIILSIIGIYFSPSEIKTQEYLRLHVRANSNLEIDQSVKYKVKEQVVLYLTPYIAECDTKEKAQKMLEDNLPQIEKVCDSVLENNGFTYKSSAKIKRENFPTRVYGEFTLESGFYDALIINLGAGEGDNWWCVVYPPLCFTGSGSRYEYKSKIALIIERFKKEKEIK